MTVNQSIAAHREHEKSCWDCKYQNLGGSTLFGMCTWFSHNRKKDKEIPTEKVDVGCKFFIPKMTNPSSFPYRG
jgi:hypothetical protein